MGRPCPCRNCREGVANAVAVVLGPEPVSAWRLDAEVEAYKRNEPSPELRAAIAALLLDAPEEE